jgi:hypothetical protein
MENERNNNQNLTSKIIHSIGLFAFTFFVSVGLLYILQWNPIISFIIAIVSLFAIYFTVDILVKKNHYRNDYIYSRGVNQESKDVFELILLSIYSILAIISFFAFSNAIIVELFGREKIIASAKEKIKNIDNLMTDFSKNVTNNIEKQKNDIESALLKVNNAVNKVKEIENYNKSNNGKYQVDFSNYATINESKKRIFDRIESEINKNGYGASFVSDSTKWIKERENIERTINEWDRFKLTETLKNIDTKYASLSQKFKEYDKNFNSVVKLNTDLFSLRNPISNLKSSSMISNILILLGYIVINYLILYPYISTRKFKAVTKNTESEGIKL